MATSSWSVTVGGEKGNSPLLSTLVDLLRWRAADRPDGRGYTFLVDGETHEAHLTYAELDRAARAIGATLQRGGYAGSRALLIYDPGLDYIAAFLGCLYGGVVAVPVYPPDPLRTQRYLPRLQSIVRDAQATVALSTSSILSWAQPTLDRVPGLETLIATDDLPRAKRASTWRDPEVGSDGLAFLQYTSGSTGTPKGVMVTHGNLLHNLSQMHRLDGESPLGVGWAPPYHDMGLIGCILWPLYSGGRMVLMSPFAFAQRPVRWLQAITRYRATTSASPNFGYDLCTRKISKADKVGLDLSSWVLALNGAEPVRPATLANFAEAFNGCGFSPRAFYPCYGLAEGTLFVSGGTPGRRPVTRGFRTEDLEERGIAIPSDGTTDDRLLVSCGSSAPDQNLIIVDPQTLTRLPDRHVGEIWLAGPSVAAGYWNQPRETRQTFEAFLADTHDGPYLRTGDLGILDRGLLFVTGRLKDLIIIGGRNIYPQDIEQTVESIHPALKPNGGASFAIDANGQERLVIVHEVTRPKRVDLGPLLRAIEQQVLDAHDVRPHAIVLIPQGALPKTSSGKTQRAECRRQFLAEELLVLASWSADDRQALATTTNSTSSAREPAEAPRTELEVRLAAVWSEVLGLTDVGRHETFLDAGGHSLLATQLVSRIRGTFDVEISLLDLFEHSTIASLAALLERRSGEPQNSAVANTSIARRIPRRADVHADAPLTFSQQRIWFATELAPGNPYYNVPIAARLRGPLDVDALQASLDECVRRHDALRTIYPTVDGRPAARVLDTGNLTLSRVDLREIDEALRDQQLAELLRDEASRPFSLSVGPLARALLVCLANDDRGQPGDHALLLCMHHIIIDGWSASVLIGELETLYDAHARGAPVLLPEPPIELADVAAWQEESCTEELLREPLAWWTRQLADAPRELRWSTDFARPSEPSFRGAHFQVTLSAELTARIRELSRARGVTPFMTLLAGLQAVLSRHTGQTDVCVGTPIANRTRGEMEGLVGSLANIVVMRTDLSQNPSFGELLARVRGVTLGAYAHQEVPLEKIVESLGIERSHNVSPLFQVAFVLQNSPFRSVPSKSLVVTPLNIDNGTAKHDLTLYLSEEGDVLTGVMEYATDLFQPDTVARLWDSLELLLSHAVSQPDCRLAELPILSARARQELLIQRNATQREWPGELCVHDWISEQANRTPDAVAVVHGQDHLTYRELEARSNQLAHYLRGLGIGREELVGIAVERSCHLLVGLLGIWKAGGAYVPLDPTYPADRLAFMLHDSGLRVLVADESALHSLPAHEAEEVLLDRDAAEIARCPTTPVQPQTTHENLAYVIYTSGSTGQPKGVEIPHSALMNFLRSFQEQPGCQASDTILAHTTLSFDIAALELFLPLGVGGTVAIVHREVGVDGERMRAALTESGATILQATPVTWRLLLEAGWQPEPKLKMLCGGEALAADLAQALARAECELWNVYGPTETTVWSTVCRIPHGATRISIGRPIANTRVYILDQNLQVQPIGVAGQLWIAGAGLARGYHHRADLTAERFVRDPFHPHAADRMYATGDQARQLADGTIECLGRTDQQIKIRGFRVELGEIEAALRRHPSVRDSAVGLQTDTNTIGRLVGFYVADTSPPPSAADLREFLARTLPDYMLPSTFQRLDDLPRTPNGKLDRRALPRVDSASTTDVRPYVAPRTATELRIAPYWCELLKRDQISIEENFFQAGGHSLLATQLVSRIRSACHVELPLRALFDAPTIAGLAARIDRHQVDAPHVAGDTDQGEQAIAIVRRPRDSMARASFAQQRLWFLSQLAPESAFYNLPTAARLRGPLDVTALQRSLSEILRRHESLRTVFQSVDGQPMQVIQEPWNVALERVDLGNLPRDQRQESLRNLMQTESRLPFDLARGPLFRATLYRLSDEPRGPNEEHVLLLCMHHIVSDGWSMGVLCAELARIYAAFAAGRAHDLPDPSLQYADFAVWQREHLEDDSMNEQLSWWQQQLAGASARLELPTDRPRPSEPSFRGALASVRFSADMTRRLQEISQAENVTLFMTLLASFQALLGRYARQTDVCVGTPVAHRTHQELEGMIGFFANTLVLRTDLSGDPSFRELLGRVREVTLGAYAHQDLPFEKVVDALAPLRTRQTSPLFQVALVLQNAPLELSAASDVTITPLDVDNGTAKYDLTLLVSERQGQLVGSLEYSTDLFDPPTIERLLSAWHALLEDALRDVTQPLSRLAWLSSADRQEMLLDWNATRLESTTADCIHDLFERQVARTPDALAVLGDAERLTYRQLDEHACQLAHHLRDLGVGPDSYVGICLPRSSTMVVGLLGILKAGGAYFPLDPTYPRERLAFLLRDAAPRVVLTDERCVERLPPSDAKIVVLEREAARISHWPTTAPRVAVQGSHLAYVLYTSGSTGQPKGVAVEHQSLVNHALALGERLDLSESDRVLQFISLSFDASAEEIFPALLRGATLVMYPPDADPSGARLLEFCQGEAITFLHLPTAVWHQCADELPRAATSTIRLPRTTLVGGESPALDKVRAWMSHADVQGRFLHAYGLTEATITSTLYEINQQVVLDQRRARLPIGRPIRNSQAYVLDENQLPVPVGVYGELYLGGRGLARGYHGRPDLDAERFVQVRIGEQTHRLCRTGDLARWTSDGQLEFLGRTDEQVKIRGLRIEPQEIASAIERHPSVRDAIVVARDDEAGEKQLVAYVVSEPSTRHDQDPAAALPADSDQVGDWQVIFDATYRQATTKPDDAFNTIGWNSSYTGQPIPVEEMRDWLRHTVDRILALKPERVLEMGCGTGGLLLAIAPHCQHYAGTDFSAESLRYLRRILPDHGLTSERVSLRQCAADQAQGFEPASFDVVVLNSVAQYFPGVDYLFAVLESALRLLRPGGRIFLGDLRNHALLEAFHASVELAHASPDVKCSDIHQKVIRRLEQEEELALSPELFHRLSQRFERIADCEVHIKRGTFSNELTRFRYDVILHLDNAPHGSLPEVEIDWRAERTTAATLEPRLRQERPRYLCLRGVPNARVAVDVRGWELIRAGQATLCGDLRQSLGNGHAPDGLDPESFWQLARDTNYHARLEWSSTGPVGSFDVHLVAADARMSAIRTPPAAATSLPARPWADYTNSPLERKLGRKLVPALRTWLEQSLPRYMVPSAFVVLNELPLNEHGKLDRRALPAPSRSRPTRGTEFVAPRDDLERKLANIWEDLLGVHPVGLTDSFFELGGHSLLAVRLVAQIEKVFDRRLALSTLFQGPTVERMASILRNQATLSAESLLVPIQPHGDRRPFFCVHPVGGTVFCYTDLARALGTEQPFYGLQAQGLDGMSTPHAKVEEMAEAYIRAMRSVQPSGPYSLGGWSLGGNLAFEMARQLTEQGELVSLLALFDAGAGAPDRLPEETDFLRVLVELFPGEEQLSLEELRRKPTAEQLAYFVERAQRAQLVSLQDAQRRAQQVFEVFQANLRAMLEYQPRPYAGKVTLLRAADRPGSLQVDADLGWGRFAQGGVDVHVVPGDHMQMVREPNVHSLARTLEHCLQAAVTS